MTQQIHQWSPKKSKCSLVKIIGIRRQGCPANCPIIIEIIKRNHPAIANTNGSKKKQRF